MTLDNKDQHPGLEVGMPYSLVDENLGVCSVNVKGSAEVTGHVYGAGKGVVPHYYTNTESYTSTDDMPKRMMSYNSSLYNATNQDIWKDKCLLL